MIRSFLMAAAALLLGVLPAMAGPTIAALTATTKPTQIARGSKGVLTIAVSVSPKFHINASKPNDPDLIPTAFVGTAPAGVTFGAPHYPSAKAIHVGYEKLPMLVYTGKSVITVPFTVSKTARPGSRTLQGSLNYQGCNETSCYPPSALPVKATVTIK